VCGQRRSLSQCVPHCYVEIGRFRKIKICKKTHLYNRNDLEILKQRIQRELDQIQQSGDSMMSSFLDAEDPQDSLPSFELEYQCEGYSNINCKQPVKCSKQCSSLLSFQINEKKNRLYFCCPSHLLRYLSKKLNKRKEEESKKKNSEEDESSDDFVKPKKKRGKSSNTQSSQKK